MSLKEKLENAGKKAEAQKKEKQARVIKGSHLRERIESLINASGLEQVKNTGFIKVMGNGNKLKMFVAIKGGRVDLSGFTVESDAVTQITEAEAKAKHLGKVRGTVNFDSADEAVLSVIENAIQVLKTPVEVEAKPKAEKKARKAAPAAEQRAEA